MSLTDVLPEVHSLPRLDKIPRIQVLARDLARAGSRDRAFEAAAVLLQALEAEEGKS